MRERVLQLSAAGVLALALTACGGSPTKTSTGEFIDDRVLTTKVKTSLLNDPQVKGTSVNVDTFKGTVQLSGFVRSEAERVRAGQLAREVNGVGEVRNNLEVRGQ
ncbi:MAG: BON domain-containing protein [Burkholderiales bacterium]|nr:BON domain-containing protein [Burkholderiales bacterium]